MNAVFDPIIAAIHIQKIAPGPPKDTAATTPAKFPIPTLEAVAINRACNPEIASLSSLFLLFKTILIISGNNLKDNILVLIQ